METINFTDNSFDSDGKIMSWYWEFGDGNTSWKQNATHRYADDGNYTVNLTVTDDANLTNTTSKIIKVANVLPMANFAWLPEFPTDLDAINFTSISKDLDGIIVNWTWDFGDGNVSYGKNVSHQYADSGTYNVTLTVEDDDGATNSTSKDIIVLNINPIADFSWNPPIPKTGTTITFNASSSTDADGIIELYEWDWNNDGIYDESRTSPTATHSWSDDGDYEVTLRVIDDKGANGTKTKTVTVENRPPIADFTFTPSNPEPRETVSFSSNSYDPDGFISKYSWSFGDGTSSSFPNPEHIYSDNGIYYVGLTVWDDDNASSTKWKIINVNIPPIANFTYSPDRPTDLDTITFNDTSVEIDGNIVSYKWEFGDGNTSRKQNETHRYVDNGNYTVTLTIKDDNGATDKKSQNITVRNVKPTASFVYTPKSPVKINTTLNFTDNSTDPDGNIVNWTWNFDDGTMAYGNRTNHTYLKGGDYNVVLTVTDNDGDKDTYTAMITVKKEKEEGVPGFEFAFLIIAIAIALIILFRYRRKKA
jgi:PKD repeat protein